MATQRARPLRALAAASAWSGAVLEFGLTIERAAGDVGDGVIAFLGYFTILTNILVGCTLTLPWLAPRSRAISALALPLFGLARLQGSRAPSGVLEPGD